MTGQAKQQQSPRRRQRRTQEERSDQTKTRILETCMLLIREKGVGGLRTAEVASAAGVSQGAQFHHFPNKDALILATIAFANERMVAVAQANAAAFQDGANPVRAILADAIGFFMSDHFFIELSLGLSGENTKQLLDVAGGGIRAARFEVEGVWKKRLQDLGLPPGIAANVLDLTFNLVRGFAVRSLLDPDLQRFEALYEVWIDLMAHYIDPHLSAPMLANRMHSARTKA